MKATESKTETGKKKKKKHLGIHVRLHNFKQVCLRSVLIQFLFVILRFSWFGEGDIYGSFGFQVYTQNIYVIYI